MNLRIHPGRNRLSLQDGPDSVAADFGAEVGIAQGGVDWQLIEIGNYALVGDQRPANAGNLNLVNRAQGWIEVMRIEMTPSARS
jgi:hypothetical protein